MEERLSAACSVVKAEAAENTEEREKELLGAYFKRHAAQTKAVIAIDAENSEKRLAYRLRTFEEQINSRVKWLPNKLRKRHELLYAATFANENLGLDDLKESLLRAIAEAEEKEVAQVEADAKKMLKELVTRQLEDAAMLGILAIGHVTAMASSLPALPIHPVSPPAPPTVAALHEIDNDNSDEDMGSGLVLPTVDEFMAVDSTNRHGVSIGGKYSLALRPKQ
ncbi:hypothetical protein DVH05_026559 [Phytophthora capsici]|nr:hypothetical protein DVH05_026559 [Phytophthora capsici]